MLVGQQIGPFSVERELGSGAMGAVYRGTYTKTGQRVAIKVMLPGMGENAQAAKRFEREAAILKQFNHANIVRLFGVGKHQGMRYYAMEYIEGFDLNDLLRRCSRAKVPLPFELGVHVVRESLRGLDYAHRRTADDGKPLGIVHRDVSPSNLLVSFEGEVKVCDFGIARANDTIAAGSAAHELFRGVRAETGRAGALKTLCTMRQHRQRHL